MNIDTTFDFSNNLPNNIQTGNGIMDASLTLLKKKAAKLIEKASGTVSKFVKKPNPSNFNKSIKKIQSISHSFEKESNEIKKDAYKKQVGGLALNTIKGLAVKEYYEKFKNFFRKINAWFLSKLINLLQRIVNYSINNKDKSYKQSGFKKGLLDILEYLKKKKYAIESKEKIKKIIPKNISKGGGFKYEDDDDDKYMYKRRNKEENYRKVIAQDIETDRKGYIVKKRVIRNVRGRRIFYEEQEVGQFPVFFVDKSMKIPVEIYYPKNEKECKRLFPEVCDRNGNYSVDKATDYAVKTEKKFNNWKESNLKYLHTHTRRRNIYSMEDENLNRNTTRVWDEWNVGYSNGRSISEQFYINQNEINNIPRVKLIMKPEYFYFYNDIEYDNMEEKKARKFTEFIKIQNLLIDLKIKSIRNERGELRLDFLDKLRQKDIYKPYQFIMLTPKDLIELGITEPEDLEKIKKYQDSKKKEYGSQLDSFNDKLNSIKMELEKIHDDKIIGKKKIKKLEEKRSVAEGWAALGFLLGIFSAYGLLVTFSMGAAGLGTAGVIILGLLSVSGIIGGSYLALEYGSIASDLRGKEKRIYYDVRKEHYHKQLLFHEEELIKVKLKHFVK